MATKHSDDKRITLLATIPIHDVEIENVAVIEDLGVTSVSSEIAVQLRLMSPVVLTSALEFFPEIASAILAGHINSPHTSQYVAALALSNIVRCDHFLGVQT